MKTNLHIFRILLLLLLIVAACTKEKTPSISIDGKTEYALGSSSVRINVKLIASSADWTCDTGADWISLLSREAAQATLLVAENPGFDAREATVSFSFSIMSSLKSRRTGHVQRFIPDPYSIIAAPICVAWKLSSPALPRLRCHQPVRCALLPTRHEDHPTTHQS